MYKNEVSETELEDSTDKETEFTKVNETRDFTIPQKDTKIRRSRTVFRQGSKENFAFDSNPHLKSLLLEYSDGWSPNCQNRAMSNITYFSNNNDLTSDESVQSTCSGIYSQIGHEENWQNSSEAITRTSNSSKAKGSNYLENSISQTEDLNQFYHHLINTESVNLPRYGHMKFQPEINNQMRKNLVDWMIELHLNLELAPETLYLAKVKIKKDKVELV